MKLSKVSLKNARQFVETYGRPLEQARFRFHFDGGSAQAVLAELGKFQNADGGFGHALEADLRAPESSALATSLAFQILREIEAHPADPTVAALAEPAINYLLKSFDQVNQTWRIIPPAAEAYPHAPWWVQTGREQSFNQFSLNPTAELLGYLIEYRQFSPGVLVKELTEKITTCLAGLDKIEMHDFFCCQRLVETPGLDETIRAALLTDLQRLIGSTVCVDPTQWAGYNLRPLQVAGSPASPFYPALCEAIEKNLDYEIAAQQADGSWPVNWSWSGMYPEAWERAKLDWQGAFIIDKLSQLKRFNRIE